MKTVYSLVVGEGTMHLELPSPSEDLDLIQSLVGHPMLAAWAPVTLVEVRDDDDPPVVLGDFAYLNPRAPVVSSRAWAALADVVGHAAEALPIDIRGGQSFILNVTLLLPALVEDRSDVVRLPTGRILTIERYELDPATIGDATIFKLTEYGHGEVLVTEPFIQRVRDAGLTGFEFRVAWQG